MNRSFFKHKSVLVTGHTGFKGAWLCQMLKNAGAKITGYALEPVTGGIFETASVSDGLISIIGDIRDADKLSKTFREANPEIVFHLAAQPLVLDAYERPAYTFDVNVQGTVNMLECVRRCESVRSVAVVTTDKVYRNNEWVYGYRENDVLGGNEPYSASKACAELVASAYAASFLRPRGIALSTARAGNVIGGGDISKNRIIPDCVSSARQGEDIIVRNPRSIRPYQHVLEPLLAYLIIAHRQYEDVSLSGEYNIGPNETDCITTKELADIFCGEWGFNQSWRHHQNDSAPHESGLLKLDCNKMRAVFGWRSIWNARKAVAKTIEWEKAADKLTATNAQISEYVAEFEHGEKEYTQ